MSIRKRFDEASDLFNRGLYEPSLILILVAVAAAAERFRKGETGGADKKRGDDREWFKRYVDKSNLIGPLSLGPKPGETVPLSEILYRDLRCELIHEAKLSDKAQFGEHPLFLHYVDGKLTFGTDLIRALMDLLVRDELGREEFRDLLTEFDNIVEFSSNQPKDTFEKDFIAKHQITQGRIVILEAILTALRPEKLAAMNFDEMQKAFAEKVLPNLSLVRSRDGARLNEGALTGLRSRQLLDANNQLTQRGYEVVKEMSGFYKTTDLAKPSS